MKLKHITTILLSCLFIYSTNSYAQEEPTENTAVNLVEEVSPEKTTEEQQPKEEKKKKKKSGPPTLPPNNSTAYLLHIGEDEFVRDNIAKHYSDQRFYEWTLSAGVSTMGLTLEALTPINSYLKLRGGIDLFFYNSKHYEVGIDDPGKILTDALKNGKPNLSIKGKNHMIHAHTLVDFYPVPDGLFFLTGGFYFGQNKTALDGYLIDIYGDRAELKKQYAEWPDLDFQGNQIKLNEGNMKADVTLGSIIKPYLGIGVGRVVTNKKLGFSFELGMMYQGDYELKQDGSKVLFKLEDSFEYNEKGEKWLNRIKWWPKVSFQVRYRLF